MPEHIPKLRRQKEPCTLFPAHLVLVLLLPAVSLCRLELGCGEAPFLTIPDAEIFFLSFVLPLALFVQRAHRQHDMGVGIMTVRIVNRHIGTHTVRYELPPYKFCQQLLPLGFVQLNR